MTDIRFIVERVVNLLLIETMTAYWYSLSSENDVHLLDIWIYANTYLRLFSLDTILFSANKSFSSLLTLLANAYTNYIWSSWYNGSLGQSKFRDSTFINVWYSEKANQSYCLKHHINQCEPEFAEFICAKIIKDLSNRNSSTDISYLEPQCLAYKTNKIILPFQWIEHVQFTAEGASAFIAS